MGALSACSQQSDVSPSLTDMAAPFPKDAINLATGPIMVASGTERTVCLTAKFPFAVPVDVTQIATQQPSSHHVIFYKYPMAVEPPVNQTPIDCSPFDLLSGNGLTAPLFIGESADPSQNVLRLPPGVAYHLEPGGYYKIEVHIVNASPKDIAPEVNVVLSPARPDEQVQYADMLFFNNTKTLNKNYDGIASGLPPRAETTIDPAFAVVQTGFNVFAITTHQHHLGTSIGVAKAAKSGSPGTPLFTNTDWQHPALYRFPDDQPLTFQLGEGLRWECSYNNTTDNHVKFGESGLTDEMCIVWGYYYPSSGFQIYWN